MFTLKQMQDAHSKVKSGADFPGYVKEIKDAGLLYYTFNVADGSTTYTGQAGHQIKSEEKYQPLEIHNKANANELKNIISVHQQGLTDFMTFCRQVATIGVANWIVDTRTMLCTYYDTSGRELLAEPIPNA